MSIGRSVIECIVRDPEGREITRTDDLAEAKAKVMADRLGVGAEVELRFILYRVTPESFSEK